MTFGKRLKTIRKEKGFTQKDIALSLGVTETAISQYESGKRNPSILVIEDLAKALGVAVQTLVSEENASLLYDAREQQSDSLSEFVAKLPYLDGKTHVFCAIFRNCRY